jgi:hypothetical protein
MKLYVGKSWAHMNVIINIYLMNVFYIEMQNSQIEISFISFSF